jgi:Fe2+ or Zn2+ uptake regulation protein
VSTDVLLDRLRARGWRVTPQRRAVAQALTGEHVHLTADQVHAAARGIVPEISLATVYNTLNELVSMGEVAELRLDGSTSRYDPNVGHPHHHLVCRSCRAVLDVHPEGLDSLGLGGEERHGYALDSVEIVFRGLCPDCTVA